MNFQTMSKQRKFVLISAAAGFISMFLPWVSISMFGYSQSVNGMHDKGILVFLCFVASGLIAYLGDQTKNLDKTMWTITLVAGAAALLVIIWFYSQATNSIMGSSMIGFGVYIAALAAIGVLGSAYMFKSPTDNIKDGFNSIKKELESKMGNSARATTPPPPPAPPMDEIPPGPATSNPPL
jgi:peptidoglycan/LPS O-acetylase OafA/YrhL